MTGRAEDSSETRPKASKSQDKDEDLLQRAELLYGKGKLGECLMILEADSAQRKEQDPRQKLVVQMHIAARNKEWRKVGNYWE